MLRELLFTLMGYTGGVFKPTPINKPTTFAIPSDFPLLHPTERESLNNLGHLGWTYSQINQFTSEVKENRSRNKDKPHGAYVLALVTGIEATLKEYRQDILDMEKRILNKEDEAGSNVVPLSLLTADLNRWELILPALLKFVQLLQENSNRYHGCKLFDLLTEQAKTGITEFRYEIEKMLVQLYDVLYRQLATWMVYGQLADPDDEFFIIPFTSNIDNNLSVARTGWNRLYIIDYDKIPTQLSIKIMESILFIGKSIATVNEMDKISIPEDMRKKHLQLLKSLHSSNLHSTSPWIQYPLQIKSIVEEVRHSTADYLFSKIFIGDNSLQRYIVSFRQFFLLNNGEFALNFIHECKLWTARNKTSTVFRDSELNGLLEKSSISTNVEDQLNGFRLLLIDDEHNNYPFSDLLFVNLRVILTHELNWSLDLFLDESAIKKYSNLWSFIISLKKTQVVLNDIWKTLRVESSTTQEDNTVRRHQTINQVEDNNNDKYQERLIWRIRFLMLFWINTVCNHIQTNVIDSHYQQLIDMITPLPASSSSSNTTQHRSFRPKKKLDFEEIQVAHEQFLSNIMHGCLLTSTDCSNIIHEILKICAEFCELIESISEDGEWRKNKRRKTNLKTAAEIVNQWTKSNDNSTWIKSLKQVEEKFTLSIESFFISASSQQPEIKANGRLDILLTQLNYNKWFTK